MSNVEYKNFSQASPLIRGVLIFVVLATIVTFGHRFISNFPRLSTQEKAGISKLQISSYKGLLLPQKTTIPPGYEKIDGGFGGPYGGVTKTKEQTASYYWGYYNTNTQTTLTFGASNHAGDTYTDHVKNFLDDFRKRKIDFETQHFRFRDSKGILITNTIFSKKSPDIKLEKHSLFWDDAGKFVEITSSGPLYQISKEQMFRFLETMQRSNGKTLEDFPESSSTALIMTAAPTPPPRDCLPAKGEYEYPWETYINDHYHYSITYPKHLCWEVFDDGNDTNDFDVTFGDKESDFGKAVFLLSVREKANFKNQEAPFAVTEPDTIKTTITVNGHAATLYSTYKKDIETGHSWMAYKLILTKGDYIYILSNSEIIDTTNLPTFEQFYKSFRVL